MFIVSLFFLQLSFGLSLLVALSSYVIGGAWLFPSQTAPLPQANAPAKITRPEVSEAEYQVVTLKTLLLQIHDLEIYQTANHICNAAQQIFDAIKTSEAAAKTAQQFSVYALAPTLKIFKKYLAMISEPNHFDSGRLARLHLIFDSVRLAFDKQRDNMLREKQFSLDLEIAALAETLESDLHDDLSARG